MIKDDILNFINDFCRNGKLSNNRGAAFITLTAKKGGANVSKTIGIPL